MNDLKGTVRSVSSAVVVFAVTVTVFLAGCASYEYREKRRQGQSLMTAGMYGPARYFFQEAENVRPRQVENLHDLGASSVMLARKKFERRNHPAAMRELDAAIAYYTQALDAHPGHRASIEGKNVALELKGQFDEALKHAEWAAEFVGPSAQQYIFLAQELEERGDVDGALLRYKQAAAMEPDNPDAHVALGKFLLRHKKEKAAIYHLQAAYRLNPIDSWVLDQLAARGAVPPLVSQEQEAP